MSLAHSPSIVTNGLVLCLDAGNIKSYPGSGTTWNDLSGGGNTGTLVNGVGYNSGNGGSLSFDGTDDYARLNPLPQSMNVSFSVFTWVKLNAVADIYGIWGHNDPTNAVSCHFEVRSTGMRVRLGNVDRLCPQLVTNQWKYIGFTTDVNNHYYYVDGLLIDSWTGNKGSILGDGTLFKHSFGASRAESTDSAPSRSFNGTISVSSIYNRALTASEIQQNFNALKGRFGL